VVGKRGSRAIKKKERKEKRSAEERRRAVAIMISKEKKKGRGGKERNQLKKLWANSKKGGELEKFYMGRRERR